jgi:hypothetical protein
MKMRNALTNAVVHRDKRPVRFHPELDRLGQKLNVSEERGN